MMPQCMPKTSPEYLAWLGKMKAALPCAMPKDSAEYQRWHDSNIHSHDAEWRRKVQAKKRPPRSAEWCAKISKAKTGKPCHFSDAYLKILSERGKKYQPLATQANIGRKRPDHSLMMKGENNPRWIGGTDDYRGEDWDIKKAECLKRDGYRCQHKADEHYQILDVHHKIPYRISKDNSLSNLITLCKSHHIQEEHRLQKNEKEIICQ